MRSICLIGNSGNKKAISDGGRIKIRLYKELLHRENFSVELVELDEWKKHPFLIVRQIRKSIKNSDSIVIMGGPKGCQVIIPLVLFLNKRYRKRIVFCPVGIGTLDKNIRGLSSDDAQKFLVGDLLIKNDKRMSKMLSKMSLIILENEMLKIRYDEYYKLKNTVVLCNFRDIEIPPYKLRPENGNFLNIIFLSRVTLTKGILDLIEVVSEINNISPCIKLKIYGDNQLKDESLKIFNKSQNNFIKYGGVVNQDSIGSLLEESDLFCLPTKYYGEGTPGSLVESLIFGTPVLVSSYSQSKFLIKDGFDGFVFNFNDKKDLKNKLLFIYENREKLYIYGQNAQKTAERFVYSNCRDTFIYYLFDLDLRG